jgi:hypothetical protein
MFRELERRIREILENVRNKKEEQSEEVKDRLGVCASAAEANEEWSMEYHENLEERYKKTMENVRNGKKGQSEQAENRSGWPGKS